MGHESTANDLKEASTPLRDSDLGSGEYKGSKNLPHTVNAMSEQVVVVQLKSASECVPHHPSHHTATAQCPLSTAVVAGPTENGVVPQQTRKRGLQQYSCSPRFKHSAGA